MLQRRNILELRILGNSFLTFVRIGSYQVNFFTDELYFVVKMDVFTAYTIPWCGVSWVDSQIRGLLTHTFSLGKETFAYTSRRLMNRLECIYQRLGTVIDRTYDINSCVFTGCNLGEVIEIGFDLVNQDPFRDRIFGDPRTKCNIQLHVTMNSSSLILKMLQFLQIFRSLDNYINVGQIRVLYI